MKHHTGSGAAIILLCLFPILPVFTQGTESDNPLTALIVPDLSAPTDGVDELDFDLVLERFDEQGFPENSAGLLVLKDSPAGPIVPMKNFMQGAFLEARFVNRQRDAVLLARAGSHSDTLPDGTEYVIPFGYGALKWTSVEVSLVEGEAIPHFSDNRKDYQLFPLDEISLGGSIGLTGPAISFRYSYLERYVAHASLGVNLLGPLFTGQVYGFTRFSLHSGGGYRFPGFFQEFLGQNFITLGMDFHSGFGDRDEDPATPSFFWLPGLFASIEKTFFQAPPAHMDYREDPRPYNHQANTAFLRIGAYLNTAVPRIDDLFVVDVSVGYTFSLRGPTIPAHAFKQTDAVYMSREYRTYIRQQKERREAREAAVKRE